MIDDSRLRRYIKREMDVEFFACIHGMSMIFMYSFERWLAGTDSLTFAVILQMFVLGYVISWFQKLLFLSGKKYGRKEFIVRSVLWCIGPLLLTFFTGVLFHWFRNLPLWVFILFYACMSCYYIMIWGALQLMYKEDTDQLNKLLTNYKHRKREEHHEYH